MLVSLFMLWQTSFPLVDEKIHFSRTEMLEASMSLELRFWKLYSHCSA